MDFPGNRLAIEAAPQSHGIICKDNILISQYFNLYGTIGTNSAYVLPGRFELHR